MPLALVHPNGGETSVALSGAREAVVSWNTRLLRGALDLCVHTQDGRTSEWLPYVTFAPDERRSHSGGDGVATIDKDVVTAAEPIVRIDVRSTVALDVVAVTTRPERVHSDGGGTGTQRAILARPLDVPMRSQYHRAFPDERGWCSPASLAMTLAFWGIAEPLERVAAGVRDAAYGGAGNWAFNVAYAGSHGLRAVVAYLGEGAALARLTAAGIPVVVSIGWTSGALPGAPVEHSDGHLVVVRGCDASAVAVNDPAHPEVRTSYPRSAFERAWLGHGGVAYLIAPPAREGEFTLLAG